MSDVRAIGGDGYHGVIVHAGVQILCVIRASQTSREELLCELPVILSNILVLILGIRLECSADSIAGVTLPDTAQVAGNNAPAQRCGTPHQVHGESLRRRVYT